MNTIIMDCFWFNIIKSLKIIKYKILFYYQKYNINDKILENNLWVRHDNITYMTVKYIYDIFFKWE